MKLSPNETRFLTSLAREQNQTGCRGPAHDLLRRHVYPDAPTTGPGSLAFSYEAVPLIGILLQNFKDLQQLDDFLRRENSYPEPEWPWSSAEEYRARLEEARAQYAGRELSLLP
jgi:hypothetical protein